MHSSIKPTVAALTLAAVVVFLASVCGVLLGCESKPDSPAVTQPKRAADHTYTVRGEIRMLPSPRKPTAQLIVRHEPIDEFENPDGSRGMSSMDMPFIPTSSVSLDGLAVGNKVEFELSVWFGTDAAGKRLIESSRVTRIRKLPDDTVIKEGAPVPTLGR